jgi:hypothetical protein
MNYHRRGCGGVQLFGHQGGLADRETRRNLLFAMKSLARIIHEFLAPFREQAFLAGFHGV